jgi:hypothetical protein
LELVPKQAVLSQDRVDDLWRAFMLEDARGFGEP